MIVHFKPVVDSTNTWGKELTIGRIPHLLYANFQTAGRGRQGRKWISNAGDNILMSIVHKPITPIITIPLYGLYAAYSIIVTLRNLNIPALFKWPNDVWTEKGKLAGILPEAVWQGENIEKIIMGIGVNVNQSAFPHNIMATSMYVESGNTYNIHKLVRQLATTYIYATKNIPSQEMIDYLWETFIWKNKTIVINDGEMVGIPVKMNNEGHLIIKDNKGHLHTIMWGEISLRRDERGI